MFACASSSTLEALCPLLSLDLQPTCSLEPGSAKWYGAERVLLSRLYLIRGLLKIYTGTGEKLSLELRSDLVYRLACWSSNGGAADEWKLEKATETILMGV